MLHNIFLLFVCTGVPDVVKIFYNEEPAITAMSLSEVEEFRYDHVYVNKFVHIHVHNYVNMYM